MNIDNRKLDIETITLDNVLPRVFAGAEHEWPVSHSRIWLHQVAFTRGQAYLVEAESGTGKSSMCSFIFGNRSDYSGTIRFDDTDIRSLGTSQWCAVRRGGIALLPQEMRLFPELTAIENVEIKNRLTGFMSRQRIVELFDRLEIPGKIDVPASRLSIGQQQRVAIIRALAQPFSFIILDEPVSHLDHRNNQMVADLILESAREQGAGIITTSVGNPLLLSTPLNRLQL